MESGLEQSRQILQHARFISHTPRVLPRIFFGVVKTLILRRNVLRVVELAVNYDCNSNCQMCSCADMLRRGHAPLSVEEIRSLANEFVRLGAISVVITGGEPLLRKDICQIIEALQPKKMIISLVTNALLASREKIFALKEAGLNALEFSIESDDQNENDRIRGVKGHFEKVMESLNYAKAVGLNVCFSPTITHQNIKDFPKLIALARKHDAFILLSLAGAVGRWSDRDDIKLNEEDWNLIEKYKKEYSFIRNDFDTNYSLRRGCPTGREKLYVSPYGDVMPCSFTPISFGNIKEEPLEKIWKRMGQFPHYAKRSPYCLRVMDADYVRRYLDPLRTYKFNSIDGQGKGRLPIPISSHPAIKRLTNNNVDNHASTAFHKHKRFPYLQEDY